MVFSSTTFLFAFLPVVLVGYVFCWRTGLRNAWLLFASLFFYAWGEPVWFVLMLVSIAGNYVFGLLVERCRGRGMAGKAIMGAAIIFNLSLLGWFKYANFIADSLSRLLSLAHLPPLECVFRAITPVDSEGIRHPVPIEGAP